MAVTTLNGSLKVTWSPHLYEAGTEVTHYAVQWRTADQDFDASRQTLVLETSELSHTIAGLADGVEYFVRVVAVNDGSPGTHVDEHGHSRAAETSAVPGKPGAPATLTATAADHEIVLSWNEPVHSEIELSGYRVEWKSGSETYDASRQLNVPAAFTNSAVIAGLQNSVNYTLRVSAVSTDGTVGTPSREITAAPAGPPEAASGVTAVGGKNSLLVSWERPAEGTFHDGFVLQWRTQATYEPGDEELVMAPWKTSHVLEGMAGHGRYYVRVLARNFLGRSEPSEEYFVMSGAPGAPTQVNAEARPGGGFALTWDRPDPYYPNNPDFRPVRRGNPKVPILDEDDNTVPQFRYDVEYKLVDGQSGGWCSLEEYRNLHRGYDTLDPDIHQVDVTSYCSNAEPVVGESYRIRIRAAYVWLNSGDTNERNGPWTYSGPIEYNLTGGPPDAPSGIEAVGGKESLLVYWDPPAGGGTVGGYIVQWRTGANYQDGNQAVVDDPSAQSSLLTNRAGHKRYHVRVKAFNLLGESRPSAEYFVMSGAPGAPTDVSAGVRPAGGFTLTWDRPDPYYPNNPDFRPVRRGNPKVPILDEDDNTVPQFRYDVEYKLVDGQSGGWCSLEEYRNLHRGYDTLDPDIHQVDVTSYCSNAEPVVGESYRIRIRAAYVWLNSGDTNERNGPWTYSGPLVYDPPVYNQN